MSSAEGSTSSICQPLVSPTSMYSMKRKVRPLPRKCRAIGMISPRLVLFFTTMLIFRPLKPPLASRPRPTSLAASMPSSTSATGKSTSFMARKMGSFKPSKLTVTRCKPAAFKPAALRRSKEPLVVSVRSRGRPSGVRSAASCAISTSRFLRSSGSPPVRRSFCTPCDTNRRAMRVISSKLNSELCGRYL